MKVNFLCTINVTWQNLQDAVRSLYSSFSRLMSFWMHSSICILIGLLIDKKTMSISFSHVQHAVYIQCLLLTVRVSLQFFSVHLWTSALASSTVLHIVTFVSIVGICSGKKFTEICIFDSNCLDTLLNWHYLMRQSGPNEQGLTVYAIFIKLWWLQSTFCVVW